MYCKPHLAYPDQLALLESRGLSCPDRDRALALLTSIGYYRMSAYVYPFRELLPEGERCQVSPVHYRSEKLRADVTMDHVEGLWRFDKQLRLRATDGLETLEVGLRTKIAHVLGRRDPFGHVNISSLDAEAIRSMSRGSEPTEAFDRWSARYAKLLRDARNEDYVRHHQGKYGETPLPIWVAVELLDFGTLSTLFTFLNRRDQNVIASELGMGPGAGRMLSRWLPALGYVRNMAAHHNRLWNRSMTVKIGQFNPLLVDEPLRHLAEHSTLDRLYRPLAVTAYIVKRLDSGTRWHVNLRDVVRKFPSAPGVSAERDMGFPEGWDELDLWRPSPR